MCDSPLSNATVVPATSSTAVTVQLPCLSALGGRRWGWRRGGGGGGGTGTAADGAAGSDGRGVRGGRVGARGVAARVVLPARPARRVWAEQEVVRREGPGGWAAERTVEVALADRERRAPRDGAVLQVALRLQPARPLGRRRALLPRGCRARAPRPLFLARRALIVSGDDRPGRPPRSAFVRMFSALGDSPGHGSSAPRPGGRGADDRRARAR